MSSPSSRRRVACVYFPGGFSEIKKLAEACYRFTPQLAVREDDALFLDITRSLSLFTEEGFLLRLSALAERFGAKPRISLASDAPVALATARFSVTQARKLPIEALLDYASPFRHHEELAGRVGKIIETLKRLGITTLDDFARLPGGTLASRFGAEGVELSARIQGTAAFAWPTFRPEEKISEKVDLESSDTLEPCSGLEPLVFVLRGILDRAMARLRGLGERASVVEVLFELENKRKRGYRIELPVPQGSAAGLLPILRERIQFDLQMRPLEAPVTDLEFRILEKVPGHGAQRGFFNRQEEENEAWEALLGRLCQKIGKERAFVAQPADRYLPEASWSKALNWKATEAAPAASQFTSPQRPARLLPKPQDLQLEGDTLLHCKRSHRYWRVLEWHGPERISGEWWSDPKAEGFHRDYYRVVAEGGEQLWVFSEPRSSSRFFLHGYFD